MRAGGLLANKHIAFLLLLLGLTISPPLASGSESTVPYPILDSGVWATNNWSGDVYWLDNERVLFLGGEHGKSVSREHAALLIFDTTKNSVTIQKQNISSLCYRNGVVLLGQKVDQPAGGPWKYKFFRGPLGNEQPQKKENKGLLDPLNCRVVEKAAGHARGRIGRYLLEGHGYLDLGEKHAAPRMNPPVVFFKDVPAQEIALPFGVRQIERIEYYDFKNAYFLYGWFFHASTGVVTSPWPKAVPHPVWWLTPDGAVTQVMIPPGVGNAGGSVQFTPTTKGVLVTYHGGAKSNRDPGAQGVYLVSNSETTQKVISGHVVRIGVSPDGCKVAFSHAPNAEADRPDDKNRRTLKMIDLCSKGVQP